MSGEALHRAYYVTALDRVGLAILAGGTTSGFVAMLLMLAGGERSAVALTLAWGLSTLFAMAGIVAVMGPVWLALHRKDRRGPGTAAATAGSLVLIAFLIAQTSVSGPGAGYRFVSVFGTGLFAALAAAAIGALMHRIAYRRLL